jgi:hypothetical protein
MICRICSSILKFGFYSSAMIIGVLVLNEVAQIHKSFGKAFVLLPLEGVISFLYISESLPEFDVLQLDFIKGFEVVIE